MIRLWFSLGVQNMKNSKLGIKITGTFKIDRNIDKDEILHIIKKDNNLYLFTKERDLIFLDGEGSEGSKVVIQNFSNALPENNETIYDFEIKDKYVIILLYAFPKGLLKIELESETMHFYPDRLNVTKDLEEKYGIPEKNHIEFLKDEFIKNKSIFVIDDFHGKTTKTFQMYGENFVATCAHERRGIYKIQQIRRYKVNNRSDDLKQIYGYIKFVTFQEQTKIEGNDYPITPVKTNAIFTAWDEYEDFVKKSFDNNVRKNGFAVYDEWNYKGGNIVFELSGNNVANTLFQNIHDENKEYGIPIFENCHKKTFDDEEYDSEDNHYDTNYDEAFDDELESEKEYEGVEEVSNNAVDAQNIIEEIIQNDNNIFLGKPVDYDGATITFEFPNRSFDSIPSTGKIVLDNLSLRLELKRRKKVMRAINSKKNYIANTLMKLTSGDINTDVGGMIKPPVTAAALNEMFGDENFPIKENYREAIDIALNTPDIALIQGPPGTGKTTLIKGIVFRLKSQNKNYKILVSSEQHEALYNVVDKLNSNSIIPPYVSSTRYDDKAIQSEDRFDKNVEKFKDTMIEMCDTIISGNDYQSSYSSNMSKVMYIIHSLRQKNYNIFDVAEAISQISELLLKMDIKDEANQILKEIEEKILLDNVEEFDDPFEIKQIKKKINSQRVDIVAFFNDDGFYQIDALSNTLLKYGYSDLIIEESLRKKLEEENEQNHPSFTEFVEYVNKLNEYFFSTNNSFVEEKNNEKSIEMLFEELRDLMHNISKTRKKDFYQIIEEFKYRLLDLETTKQIVLKYTDVVGTTCAQAEKSSTFLAENAANKYDYVIIDEAARANPLDIMIPMLMGTKVILIGDQEQLPHFLEVQLAKQFEKEKKVIGEFNIENLKKSLFQVIFDAVEKSYNEKKLAFKRHVTLAEQHRMAPVIGDFISNKFYLNKETGEGKLKNGDRTIHNTNVYGVFDSKNIAWVDVPNELEKEQEENSSYYRQHEIDKVIEIIKAIRKNNPDFNFESDKSLNDKNNDVLNIGILTFYKKQAEKIQEQLMDSKHGFEKAECREISCGVVDALQGKEFDIVILSTTRSNNYPSKSESLGFIHYSRSRVNVAFSRAKRLLIVVGDASTMRKNDIFNDFYEYVEENGCLEVYDE